MNKFENFRNIEERLSEILVLRKKLDSLGITREFSGIKEFSEKSNEFIKYGINWSGTIKFTEIPKKMVVVLNANKKHQCSITIKQI